MSELDRHTLVWEQHRLDRLSKLARQVDGSRGFGLRQALSSSLITADSAPPRMTLALILTLTPLNLLIFCKVYLLNALEFNESPLAPVHAFKKIFGWTFMLGSIVGCTAFTLVWSVAVSPDVANSWLAAFIVSLFQDLMIFAPARLLIFNVLLPMLAKVPASPSPLSSLFTRRFTPYLFHSRNLSLFKRTKSGRSTTTCPRRTA